MNPDISLKKELIRKSIHIATAIIPALYILSREKEQILIICISLFILFLTGDILRIYVRQLRQIYEKVFGTLLRAEESGKKLNGATLLLAGYSLAVIFFETDIAAASMLFLAFADSMAAIIGKTFGKRMIFNKTLEGSLAFFITAGIISVLIFDNKIVSIGIAGLVTILELIPVKINDNLSIPVISGTLFSFVKYL